MADLGLHGVESLFELGDPGGVSGLEGFLFAQDLLHLCSHGLPLVLQDLFQVVDF